MSELVSIRPVTLFDVRALAELHVRAFEESHGPSPSVELREGQWRQKLADERSFCLVAVGPRRQLVGFVSGQPYELGDLPYQGRLEKIYVLKEWQRQGIGRRLMAKAAAVFLRDGIRSMLLFSQVDNPSVDFFEKLGGERLLSPEGEFHGGYGWTDIGLLV